MVNPLGAAPIFLGLTARCTDQDRARLASGVAFNSFWLLLTSMLGGSLILEIFGITVPVVRVAGGLLVAAMGWKILNEDNTAGSKAQDADAVSAQSFYPLTLPLTVGPGSIAVAITFGSHRPDEGPHFLLQVGAAVAGLLAIAITIYVCYRFAENLARALGQSGINVLIRLSAFILICIGIQICWTGIKALVKTL